MKNRTSLVLLSLLVGAILWLPTAGFAAKKPLVQPAVSEGSKVSEPAQPFPMPSDVVSQKAPSLVLPPKTTSKLTKVSLGFDIGGGSSTVYNVDLQTLSQGYFEGNFFVGYDLVDTCSSNESCIRCFVLGGLGSGNYLSSQMGFFHILPGVGIKIFFGKQRIVSLSILAGLGYKHTWIPSLQQQDAVQLNLYERNPDHSDLPLLWFQPGIELHFGGFIGSSAAQRFSISASVKIENGPGAPEQSLLAGSADVAFLLGLRFRI